jgi:hypothetical protein
MEFIFKIVAVALLIFGMVALTPANAQSITGDMNVGVVNCNAANGRCGPYYFDPSGINYFDPFYGYVPDGFGNDSGTTVVIGDGVEFGYYTSYDQLDYNYIDQISVNFTKNSLTLTDHLTNTVPILYSFTSSDPALFNGAEIVSNSLGAQLSVNGATLTLSAPLRTTGGTYSTVVDFSGVAGAVPEPATWVMMLAGFGLTGLSTRRRRTVGVAYA